LRPPSSIPNFFLGGASRSGTTSLYFYLCQHPQVFMSPVKEPAFFGAGDLLSPPYRDRVLDILARDRTALQAYLDSPHRPTSWRFVLEWDDYLRLFRDVRDEIAIGEASTDYLWLPGAPGAIRSKLPEARLAFMLRDPAERLFTMYLLAQWSNPRLTFAAWFRAGQVQAPIVEAGRYATQLQRYFDAFPDDQLRVYLYQDYRADMSAVLRDLFRFLGVRPDDPIDLSRRYNETTVPRFPRMHALRRRLFGSASPAGWLPRGARRAIQRLYHTRSTARTMDPSDRRIVIDFYREEILRTADLIGRDLSAWLR